MSNKVTGIGGIFFKCKDPEAQREWYHKHLGIKSESWGGVFPWRDHQDPSKEGYTAWSPFSADTKYFDPSKQDYMINYRVEDLHALLAELRQAGVEVMDAIEESEFGKFGWIIDPEGQKIELWEPPIENPS